MSRLEVKKVRLSDKTWMDAYLDAKQDKGCDMCFANIYLWGRKYKTGYAMVNDCLIFADLMDFNSVSMPLGEPETGDSDAGGVFCRGWQTFCAASDDTKECGAVRRMVSGKISGGV